MKTSNRLITAFSIAAVIASSSVLAGEIYKWTDKNGNDHYVDRPTGQPDEARLHVVSRNTDSETVTARVQDRRQARAIADQLDSEAPPEMSKEEKRAEHEKREQVCQSYRDRMEQLLQSRHLYRQDESGERTYLDEQQTLAERQRVQQQIEKHCGS